MHRPSLASLTILLSSVITFLFLTGCADDLRNRNVFDCGAGEAVIRFSIDDVILTRDGESVDKESVIDHAYLLFYATDASMITDAPIAAVKAEVDAAQSGCLRFKMPLILKPNVNYQMMAIANADLYTPSEFDNFGDYLESWCRTTPIDKKPLHLFSSSRIGSNVYLPMYGGVSGNSSFKFSISNGEYSVPASLSFRRMVARIDVANIVKEGFKVEGVALCNWRDAVPIAIFDSQLGNIFGSLQDVLSSETETISASKFIDMPDADEDGLQSLNKSIYCFPSVADDAYLGDKVSTALIIKAKYGNDTESTYYRINVGPDDNGTKINANTKYLVTIQSVKGSGAPTPEEAYFASESQIVLAVVEGWDLEGDAYDMDNFGNFLVLSKGSLEFAGNDTNNQVVRVLTSKGLQWDVEYVGDNDAFQVAASDAEIAISPKGQNEGESPLAGKCRVYANTTQGTTLEVLISLQQLAAEDDNSALPDDMPFGIIPSKSQKDRVKIDHTNRTIEIDGFDPNCFNSFIDIPFEVSIQDPEVEYLNITSTLEWPLEGRISHEKSSGYFYGINSFVNNVVYSKNDQNGFDEKSLENGTIFIPKKSTFYISVGAMGPDDPAIPRSIKLISGETEVSYSLTIKPRPAIIDDVIIQDGTDYWLVMDRNIQASYTYCRKDDGSKYQAYNYSADEAIKIPFKFKSENVNDSFSEKYHDRYRGYFTDSDQRSSWSGRRKDWLTKYKNTRTDTPEPNFYDEDNYDLWIYPQEATINLCCKKMKMSKMRMYLLSDVPAFKEGVEIPICCYWPNVHTGSKLQESTSYRWGYFITNDKNSLYKPSLVLFIDRDIDEIRSYNSVNNYDYGVSRLVRSISSDELEAYKLNYLGHGTEPLRLALCHPDTYGSPGWLGQ